MSAVALTKCWIEGKKYAVSTINRQSSSMEGGRYAETLVFELDPTTDRFIGRVLFQTEASEDSMYGHDLTVKSLQAGTLFDNEEDAE